MGIDLDGGLQGVDDATVMAVVGWTDRRMLRRYQHVVAELRQEATRRVTELLYGPEPKAKKTKKKKAKKAAKERGREQDKSAVINVTPITPTTSPTTRDGIAPVIPLFGRAETG